MPKIVCLNAWPWIFFIRFNDRWLIMEWITGAEILSREGWDGLRLQRAFDGGELCPHRAHDSAMLTPGSRCFTCKYATPECGYQPVGCLRSDDASPGADFAFDRVIKSGIEELRGTVDKQQFDKGFPADLFCRPEHKYDADLVRFVEDRIGSDNLRTMLLETHCSKWVRVNGPKILDRLMAARYKFADVERYEQRCGLIPAMSDTRHDQRAEENRPTTITLPTIPGTVWDQIRIRIAKNDRYEIERPGYPMEFFNTQELGLQKARTKLALLKAFGFSGGSKLKKDVTKDVSSANMRNLRDHMSQIFPGIKGDPFPCTCGEYVCQFQISVSESECSREHYINDDVADDNTDWLDIMNARS